MTETTIPAIPQTKSARTALATTIVTSLQEAMSIINSYFEDIPNSELYFKNNFYGTVAPNTPFTLTFEKNISVSKKASNHTIFKAEAMVVSAEKILTPAAEALRILFPGQYLRFGKKNTNTDKIALWCSAPGKLLVEPKGYLLNTVPTRWKAHLLRTSEFLYGTAQDAPAQRFLLYSQLKSQFTTNVEKITTQIVDATSLTHALHLSGFRNAETSTPIPQLLPVSHACVAGEAKNICDLVMSLDREQQQELNQREKEFSCHLKDITRAIHSLAELCCVNIKADLITNEVKINCKPTLHIHPDDLEAITERHNFLHKVLSNFLRQLSAEILTIHPHLHEGKIHAQMHTERHTSLQKSNTLNKQTARPVKYTMTLDRVSLSFTSNLSEVLTVATELAHAVEPENWSNLRRFGVFKTEHKEQNLVNVSSLINYTDATSHAHAAIIAQNNFFSKESICEVKPIRLSEIEDAQEALKSSMGNVFGVHI